MRRTWWAWFLGAAILTTSGCTTGARFKTDGEFGAKVAAKWQDGPSLDVGGKAPSVDVGVDLGANPLPGLGDLIHGKDASTNAPVPPVTDAQVTATLATLTEKANAAEERNKALVAHVEALERKASEPTATPEDKQARDDAKRALEAANAAKVSADDGKKKAEDAAAAAKAAQEKADAIPKPQALPPVEAPRDWTLAGLIAAAVSSAGGVAEWLRRKKAYKDAQALAAAARAEAERLANAAIAKYDGLPDDTPTEKVAEALAAPKV